MTLDSDGVTWLMMEHRTASRRRVMQVTSMNGLYSLGLTWPWDSPNGASGSSHSVSTKPSTMISASAGTITGTVRASVTRMGAFTRPPATENSSRS